MILQLSPMLPVSCPRGDGYAFAMIDYSQEHDILFVIALENGDIWTYPNQKVKFRQNISLNREFSEKKPIQTIDIKGDY